jgi:alpha-L-glutamate ligase-like protein
MKVLDRWRQLRESAVAVLGMNQRNLHYIYPHNPRRGFPVADRKVLTKEVMGAAGVPVPRTYAVYSRFFELRDLERDLAGLEGFVVKPSQGSGGGGILVITGRDHDGWRSIGGRRFGLEELRKQVADILFGVYSFGGEDQAIIEERVRQHEHMNQLSPLGLADVRLIVFRETPVLAMSRIPTRRSEGKANLHQGAVGVGIDMESGETTGASLGGRSITRHPDTEAQLVGRTIPFWPQIRELGRRAALAAPLKYIGVDVAVSEEGPVLLEINARPGLEIQNANMSGLRALLTAVAGDGGLGT